jgi:hypothetical protein
VVALEVDCTGRTGPGMRAGMLLSCSGHSNPHVALETRWGVPGCI